MTSKILEIDLHDAGRDGVYRVVPDDPTTLAEDAARASLRFSRLDLRDCTSHQQALETLAQSFEVPAPREDWPALAAGLRDLGWLSAPGYVLVLDHADVLRAQAPDVYATLRDHLSGVARYWHARGVPFFVFMVFPDNETLDAAIDA
ncbi:MAG TPA: barstar family protein [Frateuria sp.]|uniref:barstar family protein n=1 Tax=Frateuria sp. TaxID=2211372 RepID=UPI002D80AFBF|nr:barstar family protein [Frateuria sp.]HET6807112.1 barstar family protein [Frateuria sp.]